ncbi:MAG: hypothetical protein AB1646_18090 [Thermodesulfobacteriota bacterium]
MESEPKRTAAGMNLLQDTLDGRENLEQIRDLLFGTHMRKLETRLQRLEERLLREMADIRDGLRKQIDSLETYVKSELKTINDRISSEQEKRAEVAAELKSDLRQQGEALDKKIGQLDNKLEQYSKDLREQLLDRTRSLTDHLEQKHQEALQVMKESDDQIRTDYVDRAGLSRMFTQVAVRLDTSLADEVFAPREEYPDE